MPGIEERMYFPLAIVLIGSDFVSWFFKNFQTFLEVKIYIKLFWHPAQLIESYKNCPLKALKTSIFLAFKRHARQG